VTYYTEIDWTGHKGGKIVAILPGSVAAATDLQPGDELLAVNGNHVDDVIDVQYFAGEELLDLLIRRGEELLSFEITRDYGQQLGLEFEHPTFDTDIRRCNNLCEFCFVLQMAPRFRRTLYIKDDDYRYSFLFGHFVTLTNLDAHDWQRIEMMRLSPLYVSVHVTDHELRRKFLRNADAPDIMEQLRWLAERGIQIHTQLVIVPEFNDGAWLHQSIKDLAELWPSVKTISVVPVGLTSHHKYGMRAHTKTEAEAILSYIEGMQLEYKERFGLRFVYPTDEWYLVCERAVPPLDHYDGQELQENGLGMVRRFLDEWQSVSGEIAQRSQLDPTDLKPGSPSGGYERLTLVTGTLFADTLRAAAAEFAELTGLSVDVLPVVNARLGESITVAGLLMSEDVLAQLAATSYGDLVILPRIMFDHPDSVSLDNLSPAEMAIRLGRPVALADLMGDVWDAVTGESAVLFRPEPNP
jgi:putative radical SAM enzyme (TIGR03279 family)